jgi:hypothetical protein
MTKHREERIIEDIKHHFGFLFDKGYQVREIRYSQEAFWHVILEASKYFLRIDCDRDYLSIMFDPEKGNDRNQIGLGTLVYYVSKGQNLVGYFEGNPAWGKKKQMERLASLLNEYHDPIALLFERDTQWLRDDLALSQKKYGELLQISYSRKFAVEEKVWKGLGLFTIFFRVLGVAFLAFLAWGLSILFMTATDTNAKLMYASIGFAIIVVVTVLAIRFLQDWQK